MSWYYCREPGEQGQILTDEGTPPGVSLSDLLSAGPLPTRAALELVASVADAVSIAEEDGAFHGDLRPGGIYVDASGAVAVAGYGEQRRAGRAPEGRVEGIATDVYGLGIVMYAVMSGGAMGQIPRERDAHDDHVVGRLLEIDWGALADKGWMQEVQSFLCLMLAHGPAERPAPLDVANVLFHVAAQAPGKTLAAWAARAVPNAGGERAAPRETAAAAEEDLGGPQSLGAPVAGGGVRVRQAASAKGESTAFWSRDRIAAMLAEEDEDDAPAARPVRQAWSPAAERGPERGGASAFDAPEPLGVSAPPRPPAPPRETAPPRTLEPPQDRLPPVVDPRGPPPAVPGDFVAPPDRTVSPTRGGGTPPTPPRPPAAAPPPVASPPPADAGYRPPPAAAPPGAGYTPPPIASAGRAAAPPPPEPKKGGSLKFIVLGIAVLGLLCLGGGGIGGFLWWQGQQDAAPQRVEVGLDELGEQPKLDAPDTGSKPAADDGPAVNTVRKKEPADDGATKKSSTSGKGSSSSTKSSSSSSTKSSSSSSTKSSSSTSSSSSSTKSTPPPPPDPEPDEAAPPPPSGPFVVRFIVEGAEATVECGDSQRATFAGTAQMRFTGLTTCRVLIDGQMGAIQVSQEATVKCTPSGGRVSCAAQ